MTGISMGGMQTFQWMLSHPEMMEKAIPIIGAPRLTSIDLLLWKAEASALENARTPEAGMKTVAAVHSFALTRRTTASGTPRRPNSPRFLNCER